jgi:membrane-associated phospholipid phosphatase
MTDKTRAFSSHRNISLSPEPFPGSFEHLNDFNNKDPFDDSGNYPHIHYEAKIHPIRFKMRQWLLPYIRKETPILHNLQQKYRNPFLDFYFSYSANLAAHTFYVLMLPLPIWLGYGIVSRDMIHVLGYGIFFSGYIKDFCCLPRPRSPPLHRITLSGYTAKEYGFPSSHSANATGVSTLLLYQILNNWESFSSRFTLITTVLLLVLYYATLIIGRIYCGMHGFLDISTGAIIGFLCSIIRTAFRHIWDDKLVIGSAYGPLISIVVNYSLIYFHVYPVDDCPCFDDSVAFIGVVIGLDISQWIYVNSSYNSLKYGVEGMSAIDIPYSYEELGLVKTVLRVVLGVSLVMIWKEISKPLLLSLFKQFYKRVYKNEYRSGRFNRIRSDTNSRREKIGEVQQLMKDLSNPSQKDTVGPQSSIDYYELQQYTNNIEALHEKNKLFTCGVFKPRYDMEIIVRLIVYAGIPFMVIVGFTLAAELLGLGYKPVS